MPLSKFNSHKSSKKWVNGGCKYRVIRLLGHRSKPTLDADFIIKESLEEYEGRNFS